MENVNILKKTMKDYFGAQKGQYNSYGIILFLLFSIASIYESYAQADYEIIIYESEQFKGKKHSIKLDKATKTITSLESFLDDGWWDDEISSIKVGKGVHLQVFKGNALTKRSADLWYGSYPLLRHFNQDISSLKFTRVPLEIPRVAIYFDDDKSGNGGRQYLSVGNFLEDCDSDDRKTLVGEHYWGGLLAIDDSYWIFVDKGLNVSVCDDQYGKDCREISNDDKGDHKKLSTYNLENALSSIKITVDKSSTEEWTYVSTILSNPIEKTANNSEDIATRGCTNNFSSKTNQQQIVTSIYQEFSTSVTYTKELNSDLTISVGTDVGVPLVGEFETDVSVSIGGSISDSDSSTETKGNLVDLTQTANIPPYRASCNQITGKQSSVTYTTENKFIHTDGVQKKSVMGTLTVAFFGDFKGNIIEQAIPENELMAYCNNPSNNISCKEIQKILGNNSDSNSNNTSNSTSSILEAGQTMTLDKKYYAGNGGYYAVFQSDGNLVIYDKNGTFTFGSYNNLGVKLTGKKATMQQDGNFVIYDAKGVYVWGTQTQGSNFKLSINDSGSLVVLNAQNQVKWNSSN